MRTQFRVALLAAIASFGAIASAQTPGAQAPAAPQAARPASGEYTGPKHISDAIIGQKSAGFAVQSTDEKWKRTATLPEDWDYKLAPGVRTQQVSFYVDGGTR